MIKFCAMHLRSEAALDLQTAGSTTRRVLGEDLADLLAVCCGGELAAPGVRLVTATQHIERAEGRAPGFEAQLGIFLAHDLEALCGAGFEICLAMGEPAG